MKTPVPCGAQQGRLNSLEKASLTRDGAREGMTVLEALTRREGCQAK